MLKWLFEKLVGWPWCKHRWVSDGTIRLVKSARASEVPQGYIRILRCEHCGDLKKFQT